MQRAAFRIFHHKTQTDRLTGQRADIMTLLPVHLRSFRQGFQILNSCSMERRYTFTATTKSEERL